jgi:hypothetical protein
MKGVPIPAHWIRKRQLSSAEMGFAPNCCGILSKL